ncbi:hypothetical protein ACVHNB_16525 [Streptomyces sp. YJ-C3]
MSESTATTRPPEPDWATVTFEELVAYREAENRFRASDEARAFTGEPDPGAEISWQRVALPDREIPVRVYRPSSGQDDGGADRTALPLVVHVHGGGFVGTAVQCDWSNSHVAARLPAVGVSVEHRLMERTLPCRRPSPTAGTCSGTWWSTPRSGASIRRGSASSARAAPR